MNELQMTNNNTQNFGPSSLRDVSLRQDILSGLCSTVTGTIGQEISRAHWGFCIALIWGTTRRLLDFAWFCVVRGRYDTLVLAFCVELVQHQG
jgi:hypothetical protein